MSADAPSDLCDREGAQKRQKNLHFFTSKSFVFGMFFKLQSISKILTEGFHASSPPFSFFGLLPLKVMSVRPAFKFDSLVDVFGYLVSLNDRCSTIQFFYFGYFFFATAVLKDKTTFSATTSVEQVFENDGCLVLPCAYL